MRLLFRWPLAEEEEEEEAAAAAEEEVVVVVVDEAREEDLEQASWPGVQEAKKEVFDGMAVVPRAKVAGTASPPAPSVVKERVARVKVAATDVALPGARL